MKSKIIVLLTVLLAIVTLSAISDDSDATSKVTIFDDNLYMNPYNSYHMIYDSDTDTYSNLEFLAGMYQITVYSYVEFNCGTISEYLNSGETFSFIVDYNCWGTINAYGSNEPIRCVVSSLDDCYIAYYYDYGHTTLDVVAGPYTYTGPTAYLCFGNYSMRLNSSGEIPFDYNGAHFQVILPENIVIDAESFTNTSGDYNHEIIVDTTSGNNGTMIYIPKGTYTFKFSADGNLEKVGTYDSESFDANEETECTLEGGYYRYRVFTGYSDTYVVKYNVSPEIAVEYMDESCPTIDGETSTQCMWYKETIHLDAGDHSMGYWGGCDFTYFLETESFLEQQFVNDVIDKCKTTIPYEYDRAWSFNLDRAMDITVYLITTEAYEYNNAMSIDSTKYVFDTPLIDVEKEFIYVSANNIVTLGVKYDDSKYYLSLVAGEDIIALPNGILVTIDTDVSKEYLLVAEAKVMDSADSFTCHYEIYTDGLPESDDNAIVFAVVAIAICAVFFGLLLVSGRKPKWKD